MKHVFATFGRKRGTRGDDDTVTTASTHESSVDSVLGNLETAMKDFSKTVQEMTACANKTCTSRCGPTSDETHTTTNFVTH